jgi:signal transduction histidine kinase
MLVIFTSTSLYIVSAICLILLGFLVYLSISKLKLKKDNHSIKAQLNGTKAKNEQFIEDLKQNQELINEISRIKDLNKLFKACKKHLKAHFGFDYSSVSLIDFNEKTISIIDEFKDNIPWVDLTTYNIDNPQTSHRDIMIEMISPEINKPVIVIGEKVYDLNEKGIGFHNLNPRIFTEYEHINFARVFIPILNRGSDNDGKPNDLELGILEAGFKDYKKLVDTDSIDNVKDSLFGEEKLEILNLYLDNLAQVYNECVINNEQLIQNLKQNQELINEISRIEDLDNLFANCINHLKSDQFHFEFEYAAVLLIDFKDRKIGLHEAFKEYIPWWEKTTYSIDQDQEFQQDILLEMINPKIKKPVIVIGKKVYDLNEEGIDFHNLNTKIFEDYYHEKYARVFVPIFKRTSDYGGKPNDFELGVLEAGYKDYKKLVNTNSTDKVKETLFGEDKLENLFLYVDNFAQVYYKCLIKQKKIEVGGNIDKLSERYKEPNEFLQKVLKEVIDYFSLNFGYINILNMEHPLFLINENDIREGYDIDEEERTIINDQIINSYKHKQDNLGLCNRMLLTKKAVVVHDVNSGNIQSYIRNKGVKSEICVALRSENKKFILGALILASDKEEFFNKIHEEVIEYIGLKIGIKYINLKNLKGHKELNRSYEMFSDQNDILYNDLIKRLSNYFNTPDILLWERDSSESTKEVHNYFKLLHLKCYAGSKNLNTKFPIENLTDDIKNQFFLGVEKQIIDLGYTSSKHNPVIINHVDELKESMFKTYCEQSEFKSIIFIRIAPNQSYSHLITIFSKIYLKGGFSELFSSFILSYQEKFANALIQKNLVSILKGDPSEIQNVNRLIRLIIDSAYTILNADVIGYFPVSSTGNTQVLDENNSYITGPLWESTIENKKDINHTPFLTRAFFNDEKESKYFDSKEEYKKYYKHLTKNELDKKSFLLEVGIESLAALKLKINEKTIGILIIEYKNKKFSDDKKRLIKSIKSVFETLLFRNFNLKELTEEYDIARLRIEEERKINSEKLNKLEEETRTINEERLKLEKENEKLNSANKQATEIINQLKVLGASASFLKLFRILTHDINNHLLDIGMEMEFVRKGVNTKISEKTYSNSKSILDRLQFLLKMVNTDFAETEVFQINDIIKRLVATYSKKNTRIEIKTNLQEDMPLLRWNKLEFTMILNNILSNSQYHIRKQNRKNIIEQKSTNRKVDKTIKAEIIIETLFKDETFHIKIRDTGPGIPEKNISKIFDKNFTTKTQDANNKTHGIGLHFVKNALYNDENDFAADIICRSEVDKFTEFEIYIPEYLNNKKR